MSVKGVVRPHLQPRIGIYEALSMPVMPKWTLGDCPLDDLLELIEISVLTAADPERCARDLRNHDLSHPFDRWHVMLTLLEHKCVLPVFRQVKS